MRDFFAYVGTIFMRISDNSSLAYGLQSRSICDDLHGGFAIQLTRRRLQRSSRNPFHEHYTQGEYLRPLSVACTVPDVLLHRYPGYGLYCTRRWRSGHSAKVAILLIYRQGVHLGQALYRRCLLLVHIGLERGL